jgi:ribonuclease BN (tRNA processing enzyme)
MTALKVEEEVVTQSVGEAGSLTWLGHATVLLTTSTGTRIVFDPWIEGNPKSPITLGALGDIDGIAVTHGHFDHMASVAALAEATGATVVCVPEMAAYFASIGVANIVEMNKGGTVHVVDVSLTMVSADHSCGVAVGENLPYAYGGQSRRLRRRPAHRPGRAGLRLGRHQRVRRHVAHPRALRPRDRTHARSTATTTWARARPPTPCWLLGLSRVVPIHYGTFPILTGTPDALRGHLKSNESMAQTISIDPGQSVPLKA